MTSNGPFVMNSLMIGGLGVADVSGSDSLQYLPFFSGGWMVIIEYITILIISFQTRDFPSTQNYDNSELHAQIHNQ